MKELFNQRTVREKKMLIAGGLSIITVVLYALIWFPLHSKISSLLGQINYNQNLLSWMQKQVPYVKQLRTQVVRTENDLLSIVSERISNITTIKTKPNLTRIANNKVSINFTEVPFDALTQLLLVLWENHHIDVESIRVNKLDNLGNVQANIVLVRH